MTICVQCGKSKGKRACPALGGEICPPCCGKHRLVQIACPPDCRWLHGLSVVRDRPGTFTREQYFSATEKLMAFVESPANATAREVAIDLILGELPPGVELGEWMLPVLRAFLAYGDRAEDDSRAIDRFVQRFGHVLSSGERMALEALASSWASIFEVEAVSMGAGLRLHDRLRGEHVDVRELSATGQLRVGDTMFAWLMRVDAHVELTGAAMMLPPPTVELLLEELERELAFERDDRGEEPPRSFVGELADLLLIDLAELLARGRPTLVTTHGEELIFCEAHYEVRDVERVRAKLATHASFEPHGDGGDDHVWLDRRPNKRLGGGPTVLGRVHHDARTLVLETQSRERLERGRALLGRILGKSIVHRADTFTDVEAKLRESRARPVPEEPSAEAHEEVRRFLREYYLERWIREPIPALEGQTPRAAVRSRDGRARVARLIDEAERASRDMPGGDEPGLWNELRTSLGLPPRQLAGEGLVYDAEAVPGEGWLGADEAVRLEAVRAYHTTLADHPAMPNPDLHALVHVIVENQLATGAPPEVTEALARLVSDGASRHAAVHAIASVVAEEMRAVREEQRVYDQRTTARRLAQLRASDWAW